MKVENDGQNLVVVKYSGKVLTHCVCCTVSQFPAQNAYQNKKK